MSKTCPNCYTSLVPEAKFCQACGQDQKKRLLPFPALVREVMQDMFAFDTKFFRSIPKLLFKPGLLTNEFIIGRRARYVPAVRLYIFISLIAFTLFSLDTNFRTSTGEPLRIEADSTGAYVNGEEVKVTGLAGVNHELDSMGVAAWTEHNYKNSTGVERLAMKFAVLNYQGRLGEVVNTFQRYLPLNALLTIPLFAFLLQLYYWRRFYVEHLVFTFHLFAFLLLVNSILIIPKLIMDVDLSVILALVLPFYLFLALRAVYRAKLGRSIFATVILSLALLALILLILVVAGALALSLT